MKLIEALSVYTETSVERCCAGGSVCVERHQTGYRLTRTMQDQAGHPISQTWRFPNLYDLVQFTLRTGLAEVDLEATDWERVVG